MIGHRRMLAVIPARGGSKGLPGKNIRLVAGRPLIVWSIDAARSSRHVDAICVSTDSPEIAAVAEAAGVPVPWLRPPELATDTASSIDVVLHAIEQCERHGPSFDWVCLLEPTSPLRDAADVDAAVEMLAARPEADAIVSVCRCESTHPVFLVKMANGLLRPAWGDGMANNVRRQDLKDAYYFFEGSIYISKVEVLRAKKGFYHESTLGCVVPRWKSLEVDEMCDLICADALLRAQQRGELE